MNIAETKNRKSKKNRNVFFHYYRLEAAVGLGLIMTFATWLTGALVGDEILIPFVIGFFSVLVSYRRQLSYMHEKFDNKLADLFVILSDSGLELNQRSGNLYVFQSKNRYIFRNERVLIRDCERYREIIAESSLLKYLIEDAASKKV
jgi:hypothetical protein